MKLKSGIKRLIGDTNLGRIDYYRFNNMRNSWEGGFNGQIFRQSIFKKIIKSIKFDVVIETGTFKGTTTEFMYSESQLPVYTIELLQRNYGFALQRFRNQKNIHLELGDSRSLFKNLITKNGFNQYCVFVYLDAHWFDDLPLLEEIELVFDNWQYSVIMIDDFKVPCDSGYGYDDYGNGNSITMEYLENLKRYDYSIFFPSLESNQETGAKRGCAVLSCNKLYIQHLNQLPELKPFTKK